MQYLNFLTESEHFVGIDNLLEHPEYQGCGYRYIVKVTPNEDVYYRFSIMIRENNQKLFFEREVGTMESNGFDVFGIRIKPTLENSPDWFKESYYKALKVINDRKEVE